MARRTIISKLVHKGLFSVDHPYAQAPVIFADNAYRYLTDAKGNDALKWVLAPPFDLFVIEFNYDVGDGEPERLAIVIEAFEMDGPEAKWECHGSMWTDSYMHHYIYSISHSPEWHHDPAYARWTWFVGEDGLAVNDNMYFCLAPAATKDPDLIHFLGQTDLTFEANRQDISALITPALFTVSLMNCKNTELVEPKNSVRRAKRAARMEKYWQQYHVIKVNSGKRYADGYDPLGGSMASHIVRGHFRTYTEDAPLLGKHVGTFWVPSFVRGNKEHGDSAHDYRVDMPDQE